MKTLIIGLVIGICFEVLLIINNFLLVENNHPILQTVLFLVISALVGAMGMLISVLWFK